MTHEISRRELLRWTAAGTLATALPLWARDRARIPIALQLYSIRGALGKDFEGVIKQVAEMGFEGVEFASDFGPYKNDPAGLKKFLDGLGLKAEGTHIGAGSFAGDNLKRTVDFYKALDCKFLIIPGDGRFTHPEKSKEYADFMNKTAETLKSEGLFTGHHNHTAEFALEKESGKTYWDLFAERTTKDVILQQDQGHTMAAGIDAIQVVRKAPGRIRTTHIKCRPPKNSGKKPFVGEDCFDWKGYITACYEVGGTDWFTIEQEEYPDGKSPLECTKISLDGFKKILKEMGK